MNKTKPLARGETGQLIPAISFRIFPEPKVSNLHCKVNVWRTKKEMYAYIEDGESFDGVCTGITVRDYRKGKKGHTKPIFAEMQLTLEKMNDRIVTHEVVHAMFKWMQRRNVTTQELDTMDVEERMCWAVTRMKDTLLLRLSKFGIDVQHSHEW